MSSTDFASVENYYFRLVVQHISASLAESPLAGVPGALEDVACLALNQLPTRYMRRGNDSPAYLSAEEEQEMVRAVRLAVERAARYVQSHPRLPASGGLPHGEPLT